MIDARKVHEIALHMRQFAFESELPGYAEKLFKVADDLERRALELRGLHASLPANAAIG